MWQGQTYVCFLCGGQSVFFCQQWPPPLTMCANCNTPIGLLAYDPDTKTCTYEKLPKD